MLASARVISNAVFNELRPAIVSATTIAPLPLVDEMIFGITGRVSQAAAVLATKTVIDLS
ncbi:hypothetical protein CWO90_33555 [Bradyrhizobium sp. Leo121]|nr:hypothetical protein CWO90_33555 [Bradyrhizobium sp. Leo121]